MPINDPVLAQLLAADPSLGGVPSVTRAPDTLVDHSMGQPSTAVPDDLVYRGPATPVPMEAQLAQGGLEPLGGGQPPGRPGITYERRILPGESRSASGVNLDKQEALRQSPDMQRQDKRAGSLGGRIGQNLDAYKSQNTALGEQAKAAVRASGELEAEKADALAAANQKAAAREMEQARTIQAINDTAWSRVAQSQADFQSQLATVRAMRVDPKQWYTDKTEGQKTMDSVHSAVAMMWMASGKPAMMELGKTVLAGFDKKVEQNIEAQVTNLKNQQEVSEGFRMAWQLASQNAVSEVEAKARVAAMMLQSYKDSLMADVASKYDSDLARAGAEQVAIGLDQQILEKNHKATQEAEKGWLDIAGNQSREAIARMNAAVEREQLAFQREQASGPKSLASQGIYPVADPETKEFRYSAKTEKGQVILDDLGAASDSFSKSMERLEAAVRKSGGKITGGVQNLDKLKNSDDQEVKALAEITAFSLARMLNPDGRISDADAQRAANSMSIAGLLNRAEGVSARDQIRNFVLDTTESFYGQYAVDIDPAKLEAMGHPRRGAQAPVSAGHRAAANTSPSVGDPISDAAARVATPDSRESEWVPVTKADNRWLIYATQGGKLDGKPARPAKPYLPGGKSPSVNQPGWADDMTFLWSEANNNKDEAKRVQAKTKLAEIKALGDTGAGENVDAAFFAKFLLDDVR